MTEVEKYIVERSNEILNTDDTKLVKRLLGGMSNYTYVVESKGTKYTFRVPGKHAEVFVNRDDELECLKVIKPLELNNETIYLDTISGDKMARYVEGTIISDTDVVSYNELAVNALKKLHLSSVLFKDYDPYGRLASYEALCREQEFEHPQAYIDLKKKLLEVRESLPVVKHVPCHCDFQPTNLVFDGSKLFVLDWEYAGMNDPFYDIACYGNAGFDKALSLLESYLGHKPSEEELRRLYYNRAFQCLQWYNVATYKDKVGMGEELKMDFAKVADFFFSGAKDLLSKC
jgi:thiamine kinase-like enzyme